jgi:hypothetical protein
LTQHLQIRLTSQVSKVKKLQLQFNSCEFQCETSNNRLKRAEDRELGSLNPKKSSGYELIIGKILKEVSNIGIKYLAQLLNAVLLKGYLSSSPSSQENLLPS